MKLYKISQGSTFENLKHFIYITNEYGVPSSEFVDAFIDQFGKVILNGNFTLSKIQISQLDDLWQAIVKECERNNIEYNENYGIVFYTVLCQKAVLEIKKDYEQSDWNKLEETKKLELLKQFILNFDKYIMRGIDMEPVYFEITPHLVKKDENNNEYIEIFLKNYEADAKGRLYTDNSVIIYKGSKVQPEKLSSNIKYDRDKYTIDLISLSDIKFESVSSAGSFVCGQSTNGWMHWKNAEGKIIDIYRNKNKKVEIDKQAENAAMINKLIMENKEPDKNTKIKHNYKLTDKEAIGHYLSIAVFVDANCSRYKAQILDEVNIQLENEALPTNINKFIYEAENTGAILDITIGFFRFEDIYKEEK